MTVADIATFRSVRFHDLSMRQDGQEWIVGRVESGVFVALPELGVRVITLLREGKTTDQVKSQVEQELGEDLDLGQFLSHLLRLGFVASVNGDLVEDGNLVRPSLPWIKQRHVRWMLHPALGLLCLAATVCGAVFAILHPDRIPKASEALWTPMGSLVMLSMLTTTWSVIFLHELAHLFTARAAGVPGRMSLGTRLQFLAAQTDVSGIWASPRRTRMAVYLAGMALNAVLASAALVLVCLVPADPWHTIATLLFVVQVPMLTNQFLFFMRTDVYFVVQDLARCKNLYGDAAAYFRHVVRTLTRRSTGANPIAAFAPRERLVIRLYAAFFVPGTVICVGVFVWISLPILLGLLKGAWAHLVGLQSFVTVLDGAAVMAVVLGFRVIWARAWWRRHGPRVRGALRRLGARLKP